MALGKAHTKLYLTEAAADQKSPQIASTKASLDRLLAHRDDPAEPLWWWCDALYMVPPFLVRMSRITGDHKYIDFMNHEWDITTNELYSSSEHFYFRDAGYLNQTEANGKPRFWSRGNGWVMAALAMILQDLPGNDPSRSKFRVKLQDMAAALVDVQSSDGLWRSGILDPDSYDRPEISGSAFFTYAMAYGINAHVLDCKTYRPTGPHFDIRPVVFCPTHCLLPDRHSSSHRCTTHGPPVPFRHCHQKQHAKRNG
ncbi:unnamed protein product [Mortierella alpina]